MTSFIFVPRSSATPLSPLTPMTGFAASRGNFKQDMLRLVTVNYAAYHLEGAANSWWENYLNMRPEGPPTAWNEYYTAFREHHIPKGLMDRKREEFCNLTQGTRTVDEYRREFNRLARYATEEVSTDAKKQERFCRGLNSGLRRELNLHDFATFQVLVNKAIKAEDMNTPNDFRKHPR